MLKYITIIYHKRKKYLKISFVTQPAVLSGKLTGDRFLQVQLYSQMKNNSWNGIKKLQLLLFFFVHKI